MNVKTKYKFSTELKPIQEKFQIPSYDAQWRRNRDLATFYINANKFFTVQIETYLFST